MPNGSVADNGFAFDDLSDDIDFVVSEQDSHTFAYSCCVATDGDQLPVASHMNRDVARETGNAFCT
jgi:hypothetical protein